MRNIHIIIELYSKVEKSLFPSFSTQEPSTDENCCENLNQNAGTGKRNAYLSSVQDYLDRLIQQCKDIEESYKDFRRNENNDKDKSESESTDKKSLLTEMLR